MAYSGGAATAAAPAIARCPLRPMTTQIDRRSLLLTGSFGLGALAIPGFALAQSAARGFTHSVASGEPAADSVLVAHMPTETSANASGTTNGLYTFDGKNFKQINF